ncbi:MAG: degU 1 [Flavipsychrobacter sp.]|nr:degU 1 [Flavipsychrobacter sp.]
MPEQIRLFLVDDHKIFAEGVANILEPVPNITVVGWAHNGADALKFLFETEVDVVITDIEMPGMTGIELSKTIKETYPDVKVMALSMFDKGEIVQSIIDTGAEGYLLKDIEKQELIEAIEAVYGGSYYYSGSIAAKMIKSMSSKDLLTRREKEIIKLIVNEEGNKQIADMLFISEHTVEAHRKNIFRKTGSKNIVGLIKYAYENKLV